MKLNFASKLNLKFLQPSKIVARIEKMNNNMIIIIFIMTILVEITLESFSIPGTNWCGPGHTGEELGKFREVDACCKKHDECRYKIRAQKTEWGYTNRYKIGTMSHCACDKMYNCAFMPSSSLIFGVNFG